MALLGILAFMVAVLTWAMFSTRNMMLGFPCAIFWALLSGSCYQESTATWDIYYLTFFASFGMTIFSLFAMYALREKDLAKPDADEETFIDEESEPDLRGNIEKDSMSDKFHPSKRAERIRDRAEKRRVRTKIAKKMGGG